MNMRDSVRVDMVTLKKKDVNNSETVFSVFLNYSIHKPVVHVVSKIPVPSKLRLLSPNFSQILHKHLVNYRSIRLFLHNNTGVFVFINTYIDQKYEEITEFEVLRLRTTDLIDMHVEKLNLPR